MWCLYKFGSFWVFLVFICSFWSRFGYFSSFFVVFLEAFIFMGSVYSFYVGFIGFGTRFLFFWGSTSVFVFF